MHKTQSLTSPNVQKPTKHNATRIIKTIKQEIIDNSACNHTAASPTPVTKLPSHEKIPKHTAETSTAALLNPDEKLIDKIKKSNI